MATRQLWLFCVGGEISYQVPEDCAVVEVWMTGAPSYLTTQPGFDISAVLPVLNSVIGISSTNWGQLHLSRLYYPVFSGESIYLASGAPSDAMIVLQLIEPPIV